MKRIICCLIALALLFGSAVLPVWASEKTSLRTKETVSSDTEEPIEAGVETTVPAVETELVPSAQETEKPAAAEQEAVFAWKGRETAEAGEQIPELTMDGEAFRQNAMMGVNDNVVQEKEPNDLPQTAQLIQSGDTVVGTLTKNDLDAFRFVQEGKSAIAAVCAAEMESFFLMLADEEGQILYESVELDPQDGIYGDVLAVNLDPGIYYLLATDESGKAGEYSFYFENHYHSYTKTSTPATCTKGGYDTFACVGCGYSYTANHTDPLGHSYENAEDASCDVCGYIRNLQGGAAGSISGNLEQASPSKHSIQSRWKTVTAYTSIYAEKPSVTAPYSAGKLSDAFLENGLSFLNYARFVSRLPQIQLDPELNDSAQHGAVLMAANQYMTHYPDKPANMDEAFYEKGRAATASSNIARGYSDLQDAVRGWLDDDTGSSNLDSVGHRRWLLNPWLKYVGFGFAKSNSNYAAAKVFDTSGAYMEFDFVSWPASGNFPTNLFAASVPWSVTLNEMKYQDPRLDKVRVTLTRESDGKTWTLDVTSGSVPDTYNGYLTVDTGGYGISNCIIFHPGTKNLKGQYSGIYRVDVTGIYTQDGQAAELHYQVDFFDINSTTAHDYQVQSVTPPTCTQQGYTTYICECGNTHQDQFVPTVAHTYKATVVAPTCTVDGYTDHICKVCGHSYRDSYTNRKGHTYDNDQDSTCNVCGSVRQFHIPSVPMYRMYDPNSSEHFYTGSTEERDGLVAVGWNYEGVGFNFPVAGDPVHRLYEPKTGEHLYTMSEEEKAALLAAGWNYEGVAFNSAGKDEVPQYRLHNPNASRGAYHFTGSTEERDHLISLGWEYEGIGWYSCLK